MSYCVHCGVELAESEKCCPLCGTEVINPNSPWKEPRNKPYPAALDSMMQRVNRHYMATLFTALLALPLLVTLLGDFLAGDGISWSAYPAGALAVLFVWLVLPLYFRRYHLLVFLAVDALAVALYLLFIETTAGGDWFLPLALPLVAAVSIMLLALAYWFRRTRSHGFFSRLSLILGCIGLLTMLVEIVVDLYLRGAVSLTWSPYVVTSCLILTVALQIVARHENIKKEIRKRMFY